MKRDLDEIEMEMGKERTMKVGDRVRTNDGKVGTIGWIDSDCKERMGVCLDDERLNGRGLTWSVRYLAWQLECIPVEPERVQGRWYCANPEGCYSTDGIPDVHPATCAGGCEWLRKHSPGLLQRMGMVTWPSEAKEWFVIYQDGEGFHQCNFIDGDRTGLSQGEALELARRQSNRWQDGLR